MISRTLVGRVLLFCRDAVSVFCSSPSWLGHRRLIEEDLPFCRDAVGVCTPPPISRLGYRTLVGGGESYLSAEMPSVYSAAPSTGHLLGESYPSAEMQSVYSAAPTPQDTCWGSLTLLQRCSRCILQPPHQPTGPQNTSWWWGILPFCRDAVSVFCSPLHTGYLLGESYPSAEMQLVYYATPFQLTRPLPVM